MTDIQKQTDITAIPEMPPELLQRITTNLHAALEPFKDNTLTWEAQQAAVDSVAHTCGIELAEYSRALAEPSARGTTDRLVSRARKLMAPFYQTNPETGAAVYTAAEQAITTMLGGAIIEIAALTSEIERLKQELANVN